MLVTEWTGTHRAQYHPASLASLPEGQPDRRTIPVLLIPRAGGLLADRPIGEHFGARPEPGLEVGLHSRFLQDRHTTFSTQNMFLKNPPLQPTSEAATGALSFSPSRSSEELCASVPKAHHHPAYETRAKAPLSGVSVSSTPCVPPCGKGMCLAETAGAQTVHLRREEGA